MAQRGWPVVGELQYRQQVEIESEVLTSVCLIVYASFDECLQQKLRVCRDHVKVDVITSSCLLPCLLPRENSGVSIGLLTLTFLDEHHQHPQADADIYIFCHKSSAMQNRSACLACAEAKRKCDRRLPECQRCIDRDEDCAYPEPKRQRRRRQAEAGTRGSITGIANPANDPSLDLGGVNFPQWSTDLDVTLLDLPTYGIPPTLPLQSVGSDTTACPTQNLVSDVESSGTTGGPWFLQDEVWALDYADRTKTSPGMEAMFEYAISGMRGMLRAWASQGHNGFIHHRLYERGMPSCVQDAFAITAAYVGATPAVKSTVLQIAEDRSSALATFLDVPDDTEPDEAAVRLQLARHQSLFVLAFILLFDGSIRARGAGERIMPTLKRWQARLWRMAKVYRTDLQRQYAHKPCCQQYQQQGGPDAGYTHSFEVLADLWKLWILTESIRRSHLITSAVINIYQCMSWGAAECQGATKFTARRGLWGATSAAAWLELCSSNRPLLASPMAAEPFISQCEPGELDEFARAMWSCSVGLEKLQYLIDGRAGPVAVPVQ